MEKMVLINLLTKFPMIFTCCEIEAIMDEELSEKTEKMSTALVDCCVDALEYHKKIMLSKNPSVKYIIKIQYKK